LRAPVARATSNQQRVVAANQLIEPNRCVRADTSGPLRVRVCANSLSDGLHRALAWTMH
jgi:hypothetical protein